MRWQEFKCHYYPNLPVDPAGAYAGCPRTTSRTSPAQPDEQFPCIVAPGIDPVTTAAEKREDALSLCDFLTYTCSDPFTSNRMAAEIKEHLRDKIKTSPWFLVPVICDLLHNRTRKNSHPLTSARLSSACDTLYLWQPQDFNTRVFSSGSRIWPVRPR